MVSNLGYLHVTYLYQTIASLLIYLLPVAEMKVNFIYQVTSTFNTSAGLLMKNPKKQHLNPLVERYLMKWYGSQVVIASHGSCFYTSSNL